MDFDTQHIFVLVAGTVDPICLTPSSIKRASSYTSSNNYWAENTKFIEKLRGLCETHENLALFDAHGWSGDNTKANREIAGAYLANRLCGSNGEVAYYSGYRNRKVAFHLIGHSHGGNVLNEFTKRAAVAPEWPEQWQIKSITYLSTPFFNQLHQLDESRFASDCRIINVTNDFDLTQRVIADFSMYDLVSAYNLVKDDVPTLARVVKESSAEGIKAKLLGIKAKLPKTSAFKIFINYNGYKFTAAEGQEIYQDAIATLLDCKAILLELKGSVEKLSQTLYYASDDVVKRYSGDITRHFINAELKSELDRLIDALVQDISNIMEAIDKRNRKGDYCVLPLIGDIAEELNHIIDFLSIDVGKASGPFVDLLYALVSNQIEYFDNTSTTPEKQLSDSFKSRLSNVNVTALDSKYSDIHLDSFVAFIQHLQQAEQDYEQLPDQKNLLKLCINLLAPQTELSGFTAGLETASKALDGMIGSGMRRFLARSFTLWGNIKPIRKMAYRVLDLTKSYDRMFKEYNRETLILKEKAESGSLAHFSVVSHSVSRQELYPEVVQLLEPQFKGCEPERQTVS
ncbi:hypothetical protein [Oceanospirillum beijerinckii]|uniref:hypothetical protein n=1 Tax=Oceanospirillum beijerinckii TaxID=64976 RepID=UPI00040DFE89|nr:hypothetical protein [Oceanospirillum beijerinckii]